VVAGCGLLFPPFGFPGGSFDPNAQPSPIATFTTGSATLAFGDGTTIRLGTLAPNARLLTMVGSAVRWSNAEGWYMGVSGAGSSDPYASGMAFVQIDHVAGNKHETAGPPNGCITTTTSADKTGLRGTAKCKGLRWADALSTSYVDPFGPFPTGPAGPTFDVVVTFSATP
jgi:hypothetical protein